MQITVAELRAKAKEMFPHQPGYPEKTYNWLAADKIEALESQNAQLLAVLEEAAHTGLIDSTISVLQKSNDDIPTSLSRQLASWLLEARAALAKATGAA